MYLKRLDKVQVVRGKSADKGKIGTIEKVLIKENRVIVKGVNMVKKHLKPSSTGSQGGVIETEAPIDASNVMLLDPKTNKPTRIKMEIRDGKKIRIAKKSGEPIDNSKVKKEGESD
ncbi:50S ribosomal protein L24 [Xylocopilactobacillus apicola]|uniref:Large ribosomal subunit protein uL24 n=1 Tax=Xylocopilactobacillus apicola TaxID=2932184 RepID=A0AAU9DVM4_9LACO|nr:50S ribosomal protein L24 [Xylocopilactobacillus apicola]BDR59528.1 50S ribosomal protein L24 [Xylocopilactobacillus apicola]